MKISVDRKFGGISFLGIFLFLAIPIHAITWPWEHHDDSGSSVSSSSSSRSRSSITSSRNPYAPFPTPCPSGNLVRKAENISSPEADYISARQEKTNENLIDFLSTKANLSDFDAKQFIQNASQSHNITIGLAFSGGGYRAMLCGAGEILALDDRYEGSEDLGGLLQSSTYLTGLSGGSWLVGSLVLNDWASVADIINGSVAIWDLENSIFNPHGINVFQTLQYYNSIEDAISAKSDAGFDTSITDIWGRALSQQFFVDNNGGENVTWESIRNLSSFKDHDMPFPIILADGRTPNTFIINSNSTVFEFSPYELGSWDPSLESFVDLKFIGSSLDNGTSNSSNCIVNFDNAGFVMGTSSSLFNQFILNLPSDLDSSIAAVIESILNDISFAENDIAAYEPNPFFGTQNGNVESIVRNETLFLVDGGEDQQNVPLYPLIQTPRHVDIIFAYDNSADTDSNWPNGSSLVATYQRQFSEQGQGTPFPFVPDVAGFLDEGLTERPVFFGCNASNLTALIDFHQNDKINETDIPLVVYIANQRMSFNSNTSTFKMTYDEEEKLSMIRNGFEVSTRSNLTQENDWATCVGCAIIRRSQERLGLDQSSECQQCFNKFCWQGGADDAVVSTVGISSPSSSTSSTTRSTSTSSSSRTTSSEASSSTGTGGTKQGGADSLNIHWQFVYLLFSSVGFASLI